MSKVLIIGGGAAGMMAAAFAAKNGNRVEVFEKTKSLGKNFLLREKADAILQTLRIWRISFLP